MPGRHQSPTAPALPQPLRRSQRTAPPTPRHHSAPPHRWEDARSFITTGALTSDDVDSVLSLRPHINLTHLPDRSLCLQHQPTLVASAHAHPLNAWAYSSMCVSTTAEFAAVLTHQAHPPRLAQFTPRGPARPPPAAPPPKLTLAASRAPSFLS
nr:unnamed protein product [Spirometra erinaceieuropaei]